MFQFWVVAVAFIAHKGVGAVDLNPLVVGSNFVQASEDPSSSFQRDMGILPAPDVEQFTFDLGSAGQRVVLLASAERAGMNVSSKCIVRINIAKDFSFTTEQIIGPAGAEYDTGAHYVPLQNGSNVVYQSAQGWAIAPTPMSIAFYDNVDVPTDIFAYLSPVTAMLDDGNGHVIGKTDGDLYSQTQFIAPSPFVKGVFRLGNIDHLTVNMTGCGTGTYTAGIHTLKHKTSAGVHHVPVVNNQGDSVQFDLGSPKINFGAGARMRDVKLSSACLTPDGLTSAVLSGLSLKTVERVEIGNEDQQLATKGPRGELGTLWMKFERLDKRFAIQKIDLTNLERNLVPWAKLFKQIV